LRTPHVEIPTFHGESPRAWLLECEDIFDLVDIPTESRVKWALAHIRGQAKTWISSSGVDLHSINWQELSQVLIERFPDNVANDPMDQLQLLKQTSTVNAYIDQYELWMTQMKRERSYLPQDFFVDRFVSGLKDSIKHLVQCQKPDSLLKAYWYARKYEQAYLVNVKKAAPIVPVPRAYPPQRDNRNRPPPQNRAPRECWHCHGRFFLGHKCPQMQQAINMIEFQGYTEEEEHLDMLLCDPPPPEIEQMPLPVAPTIAPQQAAPPVLQLPQAAAPLAAPADEAVMSISSVAYNGCPSDSTISLLLHINKAQAIALADTGSTSTFMDLSFAKKHKIKLTPSTERTVKVAGGGILSSTAIAHNCRFTIQGHEFVTDFRILELQGSDIILGVNWFKQHNPVTFDFLERKLTIGVIGKLLTLYDHLFPMDNLLISSDQCSKLIAQGATGYLLLYTAVDNEL
jgi:hypothetical protein